MKHMIINLLVAMSLLMVPMLAFVPAYAGAACAPTTGANKDAKDAILQGAGKFGTSCDGKESTGVFKTIVLILSFVAGILAVIMVVISGAKYITSGGDSNKVASAKTTLVYALVGLAIVSLAQIMVHFVINKVG